MTGLVWMLHFLAFTAIVGVIAWGLESRDLAGEVAMSMVIALAMLPFLTHLAARDGKPWPAWRSYAFVSVMGVVTATLQYVHPSRWFLVVPLIIGTYMTQKGRKHQRQQQP